MSQIWLAERSSDGLVVALWLTADAADNLALPSGEAAEDLHITLAFCGDASQFTELDQAQIVTSIYDVIRYRDPLEGTVSGYGRFIASGEGDDEKDVFYATPDILRLAELRQDIVNCLLDRGVAVSTSHGWTPHITLAYVDPGSANPVDEVPSLKLRFDEVTVRSGKRRIDIPFWKDSPPVFMSSDFVLPDSAPLGTSPARALLGDFTKEWIPFLPKPGSYEHEAFGHLDFTSKTYEDILRNFDGYVYKQDLPIRATHIPPDGGAIGWIRPGGLRLADDGSIEAKPEWNELGKGLIGDDRFLYTSAEYCKVWTNPVTQEKIPNVAVGLALVTRPHFKTDVLAPLSQSEAIAFSEFLSQDAPVDAEGESREAGEGTPMPDEPTTTTTTTDTPSTTTTAPPETAKAANPLDPANPVVLSDLTQVVITATQRQQERQMFSDLQTRVDLAERRAIKAETDLAEVQRERRVEKFTAEVIGRSAENGTPWFGDPKLNVNHLVSLAEKYGDDSTEVRWAVTQKRNEAAAIRNTGIFDPISIGSTEDGASVQAQVSRLAEQYRSSDPTLSAEAAITKAYNENPDLYLKTIK